jgi:hypothetical protein
MALDLRQKHLDAKLQVKDRAVQAFREAQGGTSGPGPGRRGGYDGPQFSGRLEDLREFRRCWGEYERLYYPKEQEDVLMEMLHSQALGPELRQAVSRARSLGTTWTYLEDHLREQRERIDHLLSDILRGGGARRTGGAVSLLQESVPVPGHKGGREYCQLSRHHGPAGHVIMYAAHRGDL